MGPHLHLPQASNLQRFKSLHHFLAELLLTSYVPECKKGAVEAFRSLECKHTTVHVQDPVLRVIPVLLSKFQSFILKVI